jgi:hypothetical protein
MPGVHSAWVWAALVAAVLGLGGSLFLSLGMNLKACPLCFYQRTFMMSLVAVLAVGLLTKPGRGVPVSLFALPLAAAGLGVALFHVSLEVRGKLECPTGVFGLGTAPQQSLAVFALLFLLLLVSAVQLSATHGWGALLGGLLLGGLLAVGSCTSNPPMPPAPAQPYAGPPEVCRPPFPASPAP